MHEGRFEMLDQIFERGEPAATLDYLIQEFGREKDYSAVFQARLMKSRRQLGLALIQTEDLTEFPPEQRRQYEEAFVEAAREAGKSFLADGDIVRAWPYFRAIGETDPVATAIEGVQPGEGIDPIISIAFQEGVHPAKGLELILAQHGMCRAITSFGMLAVEKGRQDCLKLLARGLHAEVASRIKYAIAQVEGSEPAVETLPALMAGRDWLFGEYDYYVDTSHLTSVLQYSPAVTDVDTLRLLGELCEYGKRLSPQFQQHGYPPFEEPFLDYGKLIEAQLGIDPDNAIAHFRKKVYEYDVEEVGTAPAQQFVKLLVGLGRHKEALAVSLDRLADGTQPEMSCPSPLQICHLAGDYDRLMSLAREKGDLLSYAAARLEQAFAWRHRPNDSYGASTIGKRSMYDSTALKHRDSASQGRKVLQQITVQNHEVGRICFFRDRAHLAPVMDPKGFCRAARRRCKNGRG